MNKSIVALYTTALLSLTLIANADDTDVINLTVPQQSNVLFVMDMSGSMSYRLASDDLPTGTEKSRKEVLQESLKTVLNDPSLASLNLKVGLSSFAGNPAFSLADQRGHGISYPVTPLTDLAAPRLDSNTLWDHQTSPYDGEIVTSYLPLAGSKESKNYMADDTNSIAAGWQPYGKTPIVDALYEAALYFRGASVFYGKADPSRIQSAHPSTYTGLLYDKTTITPVPTSQICGGTTGIVCNGTETSSPSTLYKTCLETDTVCLSDAIADSYSCGSLTTFPTVYSNCDLAACNSNGSCDNTVYTTPTVARLCSTEASASACEAANPTWDVGSCTARTVPAITTLGTCLLDVEGNCTGSYTPSVTTPAYTVYDCTETENVYQCPSTLAPRYYCSKAVTVLTHTINVPTPSTTVTGTATYNSPIIDECPSNTIILLSDGEPTKNTNAGIVASLAGTYANSCSSISGTDADIAYAGRCGPELAKFLNNTDNNTSVAGDQFITTHTIGLSLGGTPRALAAKAYLQDLATNGGGQFINASTPAGLVSALLTALTSTAKAHSFTSPTYTNSATTLSHADQVYVPVFDKSLGPVWSGNLKKYTRGGGRLVDADGNNATDALGELLGTARDLWSSVPSFHSVRSGGVANVLPLPDTRKLYTDAGQSGGFTFGTGSELKSSNTYITNTLLGSASITPAYRDQLIDFIRGKKSDGTPRKHIGDIIHSKPIFIEYAGGTKRLFVGTNEGYLHAFDESTGAEKFAFMPSVLLKNINTQYINDAASDHPYGVDGPITLNHEDINHNGIVDSGETAVLYFGLRRGGKAYYALDVTNPTVPRLLWKIEQGAGDFNNLGYTWSQPVVTKMKHSTLAAETVIVFGGGYVDDHGGEADNSGTGADIFIVKASDGSLIWKLSDTGLTTNTDGVSVDYAVPANIRVMDISRNGLLDRLYFGDTGGNVWRVDFEKHLTGLGSEKAKLKLFAELGGTTPKRKFFTEPDVAIFKANGQYRISVAIGSGQRPNPLDILTDDNFFLMFDKNIRKAPTASVAITRSNLVNATSGSVTGVFTGSNRGWYMDLTQLGGEKVLSRATTYNNKVMFNTFGTKSIVSSSCGSSNINVSRLYIVDLMTAGGVVDLDSIAGIDKDSDGDRSIEFGQDGEIPGAPHITINEPPSCVQGNCAVQDSVGSGRGLDVPLNSTKTLRGVYWIDKE